MQAARDQEKAVRAVLEEAHAQCDASVPWESLQFVARKLGLELPEASSPETDELVPKAIRVLINVSEERERRDRGLYPEPSPYFQRALASEQAQMPAHAHQSPSSVLPRDAFASTRSETQTQEDVMHSSMVAIHKPTPDPQPEQNIEPETPSIRDALKELGLLSILSENSIQLLEKGPAITISEAFDAYLELKSQGCDDNWEKRQMPDKAAGQKWATSSANTIRTQSKIWTDILGDKPIGEIDEHEIDDAIPLIRDIPKDHGRGGFFVPVNGYVDLIERSDAKELEEMNAVERELRNRDCTDETRIEDARRKKAIGRLRGETFMRHVRGPNKVAKMLLAVGVIEQNPFRHCTFSNKEAKRLKSTEAKIARERWDDRIFQLWATPAFQGSIEDSDGPMFWMPLLALLQGLRSEEAAQLSPEDFGSEDGVPYMRVSREPGNSVKSESGHRKLPVHPALIELGLLDVVAHAKANRQTRIFPSLTRGKTKGTFTENFTKAFGYYRKTNDVYWHGLDFHALRTTFHHHLMAGSCPGYIKRYLMGHEPLDEGEKHYAQNGIPLPTLLEHVAKVPFDLKRVISPVRGEKGDASDNVTPLKLVKAS